MAIRPKSPLVANSVQIDLRRRRDILSSRFAIGPDQTFTLFGSVGEPSDRNRLCTISIMPSAIAVLEVGIDRLPRRAVTPSRPL